jgi:hypothetical protein
MTEQPEDERSVPAHDHAGPERGGADLAPATLQTAASPVVDVRAHGVVGDGETDDAEALQAAVDAATPHGTLYVPPDLTVSLERPVDVDLSMPDGDPAAGDYLPEREGLPRVFEARPQTRFSFVGEGALRPAADLGTAMHLHHGWYPRVNVRLEGGGGGVERDTALRVSDTTGGRFDVAASRYDGTVLQFDQGETNTAGVTVGQLHTDYCGQALAVVPGPHAEQIAGWGELRYCFDVAPVRCPVFRSAMDLGINHYENWVADGRTERGILFDDCMSLWANKITVGGDAPVPLAEFRGLENSHVNSLHVGATPDVGAVVDDARNTTFRILAFINDVGVEYGASEGAADGNRIVLNARANATAGLVVREDVTDGYHYVTGNVVDTGRVAGSPAGGGAGEAYGAAAGPAVDVRASGGEVHLENLHCADNDDVDLAVTDGNRVHLVESDVPTVAGTPRTVNGLGVASGAGERPDPAEWATGRLVAYTDTADGTGDGVYLRLPGSEWHALG